MLLLTLLLTIDPLFSLCSCQLCVLSNTIIYYNQHSQILDKNTSLHEAFQTLAKKSNFIELAILLEHFSLVVLKFLLNSILTQKDLFQSQNFNSKINVWKIHANINVQFAILQFFICRFNRIWMQNFETNICTFNGTYEQNYKIMIPSGKICHFIYEIFVSECCLFR